MCAYCIMSTNELTKNQLHYLRFKESYANYYQQNRNAIISKQTKYHKNNATARNQYQRGYDRSTEKKKKAMAKKFQRQHEEYLKRREKFLNSAEHQ